MKSKIFSGRATAILLAMLVSALWGTLFPTIKLGYRAFGIHGEVPSILLFAGVRFLLCGLLLVAADSAKKRKVDLPDRSQLLMQFDPLDGDLGFLAERDGFLYFFFGKDEQDFSAVTLHQEFY